MIGRSLICSVGSERSTDHMTEIVIVRECKWSEEMEGQEERDQRGD